MENVECQVVVVSSVFDETPEGMYVMDRLRRSWEEQRANLSERQRAIFDLVDEEIERTVLGL